MAGTATLTVRAEPAVGLLDEPVTIVVEGARPDALVDLTARTRDEAGRGWHSRATFRADSFGRINVAKAAPVTGSYEGADGMGLLWSMVVDAAEGPGPFEKESSAPVDIVIEAHLHGRQAAAADVRRLAAADGVERLELDVPGVLGALYRPAGSGPFPAALVLGGSAGGVPEWWAALLASRGVAAAAVAYFGRPGLPPEMAAIALEPLVAVLADIGSRPWVTPGALAVVGTSKGGEAALLLGERVPEVRAVVTFNGSGVHFQAVGMPGPARPTWTFGGRALDFVPVHLEFDDVLSATLDSPYESTGSFAAALADEGAVARGRIRVERIAGPVLLVTGEDDRVWPSTALAELTKRRMDACGRGADATVIAYPDAGHSLVGPGLPSTGTVSTKRGLIRALGGSAAGNARAAADAWERHVAFLRDALGA